MVMKVGKYKVYNARDIDQEIPYKSGAIMQLLGIGVLFFVRF
jgi:hypothetical protein